MTTQTNKKVNNGKVSVEIRFPSRAGADAVSEFVCFKDEVKTKVKNPNFVRNLHFTIHGTPVSLRMRDKLIEWKKGCTIEISRMDGTVIDVYPKFYVRGI